MKRKLNFKPSPPQAAEQATDQAVAMAFIADAEGHVKTADAIDSALVRVAQAQGQADVSQQLAHLYTIITQLNRHYSAQFQTVARQLRQLHGGGQSQGQGQSGDAGGGDAGKPKPLTDPNFPQVAVAPGAQMSLDAQNADTITVNTV